MKELAVVSGGFDPLHAGHCELIASAAKYGPVGVILNSDEWLMRKKGYVFMPIKEREVVMSSLSGVKTIFSLSPAWDEDGTVASVLRYYAPTIKFFINGGDRKVFDNKEEKVCVCEGILMVVQAARKIQSSSDLVRRASYKIKGV